MAFTDALDVDIGDPTKASEYDNLADNTEFNRAKADVEHNFDISTGDGTHTDITADSITTTGTLAAGATTITGAATVSGNFAIGDLTPAAPLHVEATSAGVCAYLNGTGTNSPAIRFYDTDVLLSTVAVALAADHFATGTVDGDMLIQTETDKALHFGQNGGLVMTIEASRNVGIGTAAPLGKLDSSWGGQDATPPALMLGADVNANSTRTNLTTKYFTIAMPHQLNAEEPVCAMTGYSDGSINYVNIGGNAAAFNAATIIRFFTAANNTTLAGTERMRIDSSGNVGVGAAPSTSTSWDKYISIHDASLPALIIRDTGTTQEVSIGSDGTGMYVDAAGHATATNNNIIFRTEETNSQFSPTERMRIDSAGGVYIGDTANANMTVGLTINQGANDDEALALKSSDVAHGRTDFAETDTYGVLQKAVAVGGGVMLRGLTDTDATTGNYTVFIDAITADTALDTAKSTSALGAVVVRSSISDGGTNATTPGANENLMTISAYATTRFVFDSDGDSHQDVGTAWTNFDAEPDALIARSLGVVMDDGSLIRSKWDDWSRDHKEDLIRTGIMPRLTPEQEAAGERPLVNTTQVMRLHNGAIWQLFCQQQEMMEIMEEKMALLEATIKQLKEAN